MIPKNIPQIIPIIVPLKRPLTIPMKSQKNPLKITVRVNSQGNIQVLKMSEIVPLCRTLNQPPGQLAFRVLFFGASIFLISGFNNPRASASFFVSPKNSGVLGLTTTLPSIFP